VVPVFGIWPENAPTLAVYTRLHTQWRVGGMGSLIGLDYATLPFFLELDAVPRPDWPEVVTGVQLMEAEALRLLRKQSKS